MNMPRLSMTSAILLVASTLIAAPPPLPPTPAPIDALISATPFELDQGFRFDWSAERPLVTSGHVLVISADPDLVYPRQTAEPILYVGGTTAMRVNVAYPSGRVIAIVPGDLQPTSTRIWFGEPGLPEQVTAADIDRSARLAEAAGIAPLVAVDVMGALERGGPILRAPDLGALLDSLAVLAD